MVDPLTLLAFIPAALALNLTPGADMMFCMGQGLRSGPRAAWAASAGIAVGSLAHVSIAGLGLAAVVTTVPMAFDLIRWVGVTYLLWLAYHAVRGGATSAPAAAAPAQAAFRDGFIVNLTNPKVILFVLAFVPQFVDPKAGSVFAQFLIFGSVLGLGGFVINGLVGVFSGSIGRRLTRANRALGWATGMIYAALALRLAVFERA